MVDPALFEEIGTYGGELVLGLSAAPRSFNFYGVIDNNAYTVLYNILDPLVAENPQPGSSSRPWRSAGKWMKRAPRSPST